MVVAVSIFTSCDENVQGIAMYQYKTINLDGSQGMEYLIREANLILNGIPKEKFSRFDVVTKGNSEKNALENGDNQVVIEFERYAAKIDKSKLTLRPYKLQILRDELVKKDEIVYEAVPKVIYEYVFE